MAILIENTDVIVIGAGHAGIEAALACARLGCKTLCFTTTLDFVGNMPCNPAIGGTGKGQLVRELDALGGEMGKAADACCIQYRMLNRGKGPAVHSHRAQADRAKYTQHMKCVLENQPNLTLKQGEVVDLIIENSSVTGVVTHTGLQYGARAVILCCGTFLGGKTFVGSSIRTSGPDGVFAAEQLTACLKAIGLPMRRFKTGTPPRIDGTTVDYSKMEPQYGDTDIVPFSFFTEHLPQNTAICHLTYTNEQTHTVIHGALDRSPLYDGAIEGTGPRYCPSIEDKVVRFAEKPRHQIFLEPCGSDTRELYVGGLSTSLPEDVQIAMLRTIPGLEQAQIMRPGYAIEYDCFDPTCLTASLKVKGVDGLFAAGQICATSGYEEAAAQGLVAGINAVRHLRGQEEFILSRADGYIGTLIDDIVTKGTNEPYRMMTSRSEYRLFHRQDNADKRLMPKGYAAGLITRERLTQMEQEYATVDRIVAALKSAHFAPDRVNPILAKKNSTPVASGVSLYDLLKRPELSLNDIKVLAEDGLFADATIKIEEQVEINIKYEGYLNRQEKELETRKKWEDYLLPADLDYQSIELLRLEARQKLAQIRPKSLGQAGRISGVSPADISALILYLGRGNHA